MLVVMFGFALSLFPLLRNTAISTFDETLLLLFKTLLGDVEAFEEFDQSAENRYAFMGRLLLVLYLVVMTIMLLNLLIAVLSTAYAKVETNADKRLEVSKVRTVEHFRLIVASDILPAPFNLVQLIFTVPFILTGTWKCKAYRRISKAVGCVSFWLVLSPLAVVAGILLWVASSIFRTFFFLRELMRSAPSFVKLRASCEHIKLIFFCLLGAPICLILLWVRESFRWIVVTPIIHVLRFCASCGGRGTRTHPTSQENEGGNVSNSGEITSGHPSNEVDEKADVHSMLEASGVRASDLHKYLQDPMIDPEVRPDEVERGTTVEHIKLLRNRLEKIFNERVDRLEKKFNERVDLLKDDLCKLVKETRCCRDV